MGRNQKPGISFYRVDCGHISEKGVRLLINEFGSDGYYIYRSIIDYGHKEWGYYFDVKDTEALELFATDECRMKLTLIKEVIQGCIRRGLFDKTVADTFGKLTNEDMQEVFILGTADRRSKGSMFEMQEEWLLLPPEKLDRLKLVIVPPNKKIVPPKYPQNKEEKIITNKSKPAAQAPLAGATTDLEPIPVRISRILGAEFLKDWERWKKYKLDEFKFKYKSFDSEDASLTKLINLSGGDVAMAKKIMQQSIENTWKGFFELDTPKGFNNEQPAAGSNELEKSIKRTQGKDEQAINYLYDIFNEDPSKVTIISIYDSYYNILKTTEKISFGEDKENEIRKTAVEQLAGEQKELSEPNIKSRMKKIGVLEFFIQSSKEGKEVIFS